MGDEGEGAKFAYVLIGDKETPIKVMVNTDCGTESLTDFVRSALTQQLRYTIR